MRSVAEEYDRLRSTGASHNMAEILAFRSAPGVSTGNMQSNGDYGTDSPILRRRLSESGADKNGTYCPELARYMGDPRAVVRDRSDYGSRRRAIDYKGPPGKVDLAPHILERRLREEVAREPSKGETPKRLRETAEEVKEKALGNYA